MDIAGQINAIHREVRGRTVVLSRRYEAAAEDVWHACTDPGRLASWFLPVTGDLRPGGTYQLEGNASGDITQCEPPRLLRVTWIFGEGPGSAVELRLEPEDAGTRLGLEHSGLTDDRHWDQFGPGAVGVGWDLALLGLALHLSGERIADPDEWGTSPEARELMTQSAKAWGAAHVVSGEDPARARAAVARTTSFYVPPRA